MGRGLSELQRYVLAEAGKRERLYHCEVFVGFFRWKPSTPLWYDEDGSLSSVGQQRFNPEKIGVKQYRSARAALSRACRRLEARGLVECHEGMYARWACVIITDKGREWLSVDTVPRWHRVNR